MEIKTVNSILHVTCGKHVQDQSQPVIPRPPKKKTLLKGNNLCPLEKKNQKEGHSYSP